MTQSKLSQWLKILIPILEASLAELKSLPARTQEELNARITELRTTMFWVDASEREVPRPKDNDTQKATFSVKKHKNSVKNTLLCQENQEILFLGITQEGSVHDITLLREDEIVLPKDSTLLQDLGYEGHLPENVTIIMPYKKPKNKELNLNEKILNVWISSCRIVVEHAIAGVKRLRCVLDEIRLKTTDILDRVMSIACGLHNLRVKSRT